VDDKHSKLGNTYVEEFLNKVAPNIKFTTESEVHEALAFDTSTVQ